MKNINTIIARIEESKTRSAWSAGVKLYALELLEDLKEGIEGGYYCDDDILAPNILDKMLLNGARCWIEYSWGGSSLAYDRQIAQRLCTATELKRTKNGELEPNKNEHWLDVQARALFQANNLIRAHASALDREEVSAC